MKKIICGLFREKKIRIYVITPRRWGCSKNPQKNLIRFIMNFFTPPRIVPMSTTSWASTLSNPLASHKRYPTQSQGSKQSTNIIWGSYSEGKTAREKKTAWTLWTRMVGNTGNWAIGNPLRLILPWTNLVSFIYLEIKICNLF